MRSVRRSRRAHHGWLLFARDHILDRAGGLPYWLGCALPPFLACGSLEAGVSLFGSLLTLMLGGNRAAEHVAVAECAGGAH